MKTEAKSNLNSYFGKGKIKNKYRFNILIKYKKDDKLKKVLNEINTMSFKNTTVDININI